MPQFFMKNAQKGKKRKPITKPSIKPKLKVNDKVDFDDDDDIASSGKEESDYESESDHETAQSKRLRLAKEYIKQLENEEIDTKEADEIDKDAIAHRLQQDVLEDAGQLQKFIADTITPDHDKIQYMRGHKFSVTCVVVSSDNKSVFSASKDGSIIKWSMTTSKKLAKIDGVSKKSDSDRKGHKGQIYALAISSDIKFLASSGQDTFINIWNPLDLSWLHTFKGHRNIVTSLAFQNKQHQLFSASHDKTIKVWNLNEMAYVETLYGHEDAVLGIDSLSRDHAVSCGGRDRSVRLWKIADESQLVFHSSNISSSFDCVTMLNEDYFLAGGDDGSLSVFNVRKKKPVTLRTNAHVKSENSPPGSCDESWVSSAASLPYTDLVATGSCDGCIKLWRCEKSFKALMPVHNIKVNGFVNALKFTTDGEYLIAAIGQEHRLGRWWQMKNVKNSICIIPLKHLNTSNNKGDT